MHDDDLEKFETQGAAPLPISKEEGSMEYDGARLWYACYGTGPAVVLLHGGLGHSGNWGYQVSALVRSGLCVPVLVVQSEHDEFVKAEHAEYISRSIPGAALTILPGVSHFAPLQRPERFNRVLLAFLHDVLPSEVSAPEAVHV